jgi:hypothetical protein
LFVCNHGSFGDSVFSMSDVSLPFRANTVPWGSMSSADRGAETKSEVVEGVSTGSTPSNRPTTLSYNEAHHHSLEGANRGAASAARVSTTPCAAYPAPTGPIDDYVSTSDSGSHRSAVLHRRQTASWYAIVTTDSTDSRPSDLSEEHVVHTESDVRSLVRALRPPGVMSTTGMTKPVVRRLMRTSQRMPKLSVAEPVAVPKSEPQKPVTTVYVPAMASVAVFVGLIVAAIAGWYSRGLWNTISTSRNIASATLTAAPAVGAPAVGAPAVGAPVNATNAVAKPAVNTPAVATPVVAAPVTNVPVVAAPVVTTRQTSHDSGVVRSVTSRTGSSTRTTPEASHRHTRSHHSHTHHTDRE